MNEVNTAMDGRPDVEVRAVVTFPASVLEAHVRFSSHCRFCTETTLTPDPRTAVRWADDHEASEGHRFSKAEYLSSIPVAPPEGLEVPIQEAEDCNCGFAGNPNMSTHAPECPVAKARAARAEANGRALSRPRMSSPWGPNNVD